LRRKNSKELILKTLSSAIMEKESLTALAIIFEMLNRVLALHLSELQRETFRPPSDLPRDNRDLREVRDALTADVRADPQGAISIIPASPAVDITQKNTSKFWHTFTNTYKGDDKTKPKNGVASGSHNESSTSTFLNPPSLRVGVKDPSREDPTQVQKQVRVDGSMVLEQEEIYTRVFLPVEEMNVVDFRYLVAVVVEYIRCLNFQYVPAKSFIYELVIHLLVQNNRFYQLHQFLQYHVISDSLHVACQLLSLETQYPPAYQLALDMLKRLSSPELIVEVLLTKGQVIQALRFVKNQKTEQIKQMPNTKRVWFLEAALNSEDPTVFYTVYHYFKKQEIDLTEYEKQFNKKYGKEDKN